MYKICDLVVSPNFSLTFEQLWSCEGIPVDDENLRKGGASGVIQYKHQGKMLYVKRQDGQKMRCLRYPLGVAPIYKEFKAYQALSKLSINFPKIYYAGLRKNNFSYTQGILATAAIENAMVLDEYIQAFPKEKVLPVLKTLAQQIAIVHQAGWRHGSFKGKHVFVNLTAESPLLTWIDVEKAAYLPLHIEKRLHDLPRFKFHTEISEDYWVYFLAQYFQFNPKWEKHFHTFYAK